MPRRFEFILYALLIGSGLILSGILNRSRRAPSIPPLEQQTAPLPPRANQLQPGFHMTVPETPERSRHRVVSLGTAFAINDSGDWATARHVSRHCAALVVLDADGEHGYPVRMVVNHPRTDLSVLVTGGSFDRLTIAARDPGRRETAFFIGFPRGNPASVEASYLGSSRVDVTDGPELGGDSERIQGDFWVEDRRVPGFQGSLGGLSGGPVLDASGSVIGVAVAEEPRRGRVVSIAPRNLTELLDGAGSIGWVASNDSTKLAKAIVTDANFGRYGDDLRAKSSVAEVYCYGYRSGIQPRRPRL